MHLGYSEYSLREIERQELVDQPNDGEVSERAKMFTCSLLSFISLVLIIFGYASNSLGYSPALVLPTTIGEMSMKREYSTKPFSVDELDADNRENIVENAFYNFWYLNSKILLFENEKEGSSVKYTVTFFEDVKKTKDGVTSVLGFFSPVIPEGQSSNIFNLQYGDVCVEAEEEEEKKHVRGTVEVVCGEELAVTSLVENDPCSVSIVVTSPERCNPKEIYGYLSGKEALADDGEYWHYKVISVFLLTDVSTSLSLNR